VRRMMALFVAVLMVGGASVQLNRADLANAGWACFQPPPEFNPHITAPRGPARSNRLGRGPRRDVHPLATSDLEAESAALLGIDRLIRSDLPVAAMPDGPTDPCVQVAVRKVRLEPPHLPHLRQSVLMQ
jgi:hypothetical protein